MAKKVKPLPKVELSAIAQNLVNFKVLVNHAYQAYQLVKEQSISQNLTVTDEEIADVVKQCWPHLFAVDTHEN